MWEKIKAFWSGSVESWTMKYAVLVPFALSWAFTNWDTIAAVVLDPTLTDQLKQSFQAYPLVIGWVVRLMTVVSFITRARSIIKSIPSK
jgi:hypothetical protein